MPKCDFNKVAMQIFLLNFGNTFFTFPKNTSGGLLLKSKLNAS